MSTTSETSAPARGHTSLRPGVHLGRVITAASAALALTAPGQTAAMSVFVDPLIDSLGLSRTAVSTAYMFGSLSGALLMPFLGRLIDRFGPRRIMAGIGVGFGIVLLAASTVTEIVGLTAAFIGVRVGGQAALNLVATTTVAVYVHHRRGFAMGVTSAVGTAGISLAPVLLEHLIGRFGWREVWALEGLAVLVLVLVAALLVLPRSPATAHGTGNRTEHAEPEQDESEAAPTAAPEHGQQRPLVDWTLGEAVRTGMFWVVASGVGVCSLISTALNFHQVALLGERGLSAAEAAATFVPQTLAGLAASFLIGWLADHVADRVLITAMMIVMTAATAGAGWVHPGWTAVVYGMALGICGNGLRTLEGVAFPRCFGLRHIGVIRGVVHSVTVGASAFGPVLLATGRSWSVSYQPVLLALCLLPLAVVIAAVVVTPPPPAPPGRRSPERGVRAP